MEIRELKNPPIKEALIEIKFNPNKEIKLEQIKSFAESLSTKYPSQQPLETHSLQIHINEDDQKPTQNFERASIGYRLENSKKNRVLILAIDRLAVSFYAPYTSWPSLFDKTKEILNEYLEFIPQKEIVRLGLRYINVIDLVVDHNFTFENYIKIFPKIPVSNELGETVVQAETSVIMSHLDEGCFSNIRQNFKPIPRGSEEHILPYTLDLDVFHIGKYEIDNVDLIWPKIEKMRNIKNEIFFNSVTDEVINQYDK